jgi:hypothetical protein
MYKAGDVVRVKSDVQDELTGIFMENWQGRVIDFANDAATGEPLVCVEWDSVTARNLPIQYIMMSNQEDMDWSSYYLALDEVEPAPTRDTPEQAEQAIRELDAKYYWKSLGEQGERIHKIVGELDLDDDARSFKVWLDYLKKQLKFPFKAQIITGIQGGYAQEGEMVNVINFANIDDFWGIMMRVSTKKGMFDCALSDLSVEDENAPNFLPISDYAFWYDNTTDYEEE